MTIRISFTKDFSCFVDNNRIRVNFEQHDYWFAHPDVVRNFSIEGGGPMTVALHAVVQLVSFLHSFYSFLCLGSYQRLLPQFASDESRFIISTRGPVL
jgi:hypothetical protein